MRSRRPDRPRRWRLPGRAGARSLLRFLTCGSVDDGKSTLIGRLLYDTKLIFEDQLAALESDSRKHGTAASDIDFALLVDGLEAEREQGITIDVAYRFFATDSASSSSPTRPATSSTRATWRPAPRRPTSPSS
jgi:translation elongation factor EF-1alpha